MKTPDPADSSESSRDASNSSTLSARTWLTFALITLASAALVTFFALAGLWLASALLAIGLGLALAWTLLVTTMRERSGRRTAPQFLYMLWLVALGRVLAIGLVWLAILFMGSMASWICLLPFIFMLNMTDPISTSSMLHAFYEIMLTAAMTVIPLLLSAWFAWKKLWPTILNWWRDDIQGRTIKF